MNGQPNSLLASGTFSIRSDWTTAAVPFFNALVLYLHLWQQLFGSELGFFLAARGGGIRPICPQAIPIQLRMLRELHKGLWIVCGLHFCEYHGQASLNGCRWRSGSWRRSQWQKYLEHPLAPQWLQSAAVVPGARWGEPNVVPGRGWHGT